MVPVHSKWQDVVSLAELLLSVENDQMNKYDTVPESNLS
jgi:hypothetical protein